MYEKTKFQKFLLIGFKINVLYFRVSFWTEQPVVWEPGLLLLGIPFTESSGMVGSALNQHGVQ